MAQAECKLKTVTNKQGPEPGPKLNVLVSPET